MPNRAPTLTSSQVTFRRLSETSAGQPASNGAAYGQGDLSFSRDGGRIAWVSFSSNFYAGDDYWSADIFVKDLASGLVTHVSTTAGGAAASYGDMPPGVDRGSFRPIFSPDGSKLLFSSAAINLVAGDTNGVHDLFIKDLVTGAVTRVSTDASGGQLNGASRGASFSADGSKIVFISAATNLVPGDTNGVEDVFVKDLASGAVTRVSTATGGAEGNGRSTGTPTFSPDGGRVLFSSIASNLVADDSSGGEDVFFKELATGAVTRVSTGSSGAQIQGGVSGAVLSPDGSKLAFVSSNPWLAAGDNSGADVFIKDLATGAVTRIAPPPSANGYFYSTGHIPTNLSWAPNGQKLAFDMGEPYLTSPNNRHAFVYDLGTASLTHFTTTSGFGGGGGHGPVFSPDSNSIAFVGGTNAYVPTPADGAQYYLATFGGSPPPLSYREDSPSIALFTSIELKDDQSNFAGGSLKIAIGGAVAGDQLSIAPSASISVSGTTISYNGTAFGTVTSTNTEFVIALNANATPAAAAAVILAARYVHAGQEPTNASRTATVTLVDGGGTADGGADTAVLSRTIDVVSVNDGPFGASRSFQMNSGQTHTFRLDHFGYQDFDGDAFLSVDLGPPTQGQGNLFFDSDGPGGAAPVLFTGSTVLASDIAAGRLSYVPGSFSGSASISFVVRDDGGTANGGFDVSGTNWFTFSVSPANVRPVVSTSAGTTNYVEGANTVAEVSVDPQLSFFDDRHPDGGAVTAATVRITGNYRPGEDLLKMPDGAFLPATSSWDASSGTLTITATGEIAIEHWQQLLRNIRYVNTSDTPDTAQRTISFQASDAQGFGAAATRTLAVTPVNDAPDLDLNGTASGTESLRVYIEQAPPMAIMPDAVVNDADSADFEGAQLSVRYAVPAWEPGAQLDVLGILNQGAGPGQVSVSGSVVSVGGVAVGTFTGGGANTTALVVTFNANATLPAVQAVLRAVSYYNGSDRPPAVQSFEIRLSDGDGGTSAVATAGVGVRQVDDPTTLDLNGAAAGKDAAADYEIGKPLTVLAPSAQLIDEDTDNFANGVLTLRLVGGRAGDTIGIIDQGMDAGQIAVVDGNVVAWGGMRIGTVYPLQGRVIFDVQMVPAAAVEALVRAIGFTNSQPNPATTPRVIEFQLVSQPGAQPVVQKVTVSFVPPATPVELTGDDGPNELIGGGGNDRLFGMGGNDTLTGNGGNDFLDGGTGNDTINGNDGDDRIFGGDGDDQIWGGNGKDVIDGGFGADFLRGDAGDDLFNFSAVHSGTAETPIGLIDGGENFDTIDFSAISPVVLGTLQTAPGVFVLGAYVGSQRFQIQNVERILFGAGSDTISLPFNHTSHIELRAGAGNDRLSGGGNAQLFGEAGDDEFFISGTFGESSTFGRVDGGAGADLLKLNIAFDVDLETGFATSGSATYSLVSIEHVQAAATGGYKTKVTGSAAAERMSVNTLFDDGSVGVEFSGGGGNDWLSGSVASDRLFGGAGDDEIVGRQGNDVIDGGDGVDTAVFGYASTAASALIVGGSLQVVGPEGTDLLTGIEWVRFTDRVVDVATLATDALVDDAWYLARYPDVAAAGLDPDLHFGEFGWREGRDPNAFFDTRAYLAANPEVRAAGVNPLIHYAQTGFRTGRDPSLLFDADLYLARNPDVRAAGFEPLQHFLQMGQAEGRRALSAQGPLNEAGFDRQFYLMTNPDVAAAGLDPFQHFLSSGWREGRDPNALFDVDFYLGANPDVRAAGINPLLHFNESGWREGRDPAPNFDTQFYLARNQDAANVNPMIHFLTAGRAEGRLAFGTAGPITPEGFDSTFYLRANPDVAAAGIDPRQHFTSFGWREGRDPNALFDTSAYLAANPDVRAAGLNPLLHYNSFGWREGRDPGPAFDTGSYLALNRDVAAAGINPMTHFLEYGAQEGRMFGPAIGPLNDLLFDAQYYLQVNRDVAAAGVNPFQHFLDNGWREGRDPNAWFDTSYYLRANPDVAAAGLNPLIHYMRHGWQEGRDPSASFDTSFYLAQNPDVAAAGMNPLFHFLNFGAAEGRAPVPGQPSVPRPAAAAFGLEGSAQVFKVEPLEVSLARDGFVFDYLEGGRAIVPVGDPGDPFAGDLSVASWHPDLEVHLPTSDLII